RGIARVCRLSKLMQCSDPWHLMESWLAEPENESAHSPARRLKTTPGRLLSTPQGQFAPTHSAMELLQLLDSTCQHPRSGAKSLFAELCGVSHRGEFIDGNPQQCILMCRGPNAKH